ncbi:DUF559 domain-containing protein [Actinomycetes bacterium M1A6_2h]
MGIHTAGELMASGMGRGAITYRTRTGTLLRLLPQIYADREPSYYERCVAVTKWKPSAVLSHATAAWLWNLPVGEPTEVHATVPVSVGVRGPHWVVLHRRSVPASMRHRGLRVVPMEQCVIDVAVTMTVPELEKFIDTVVSELVDLRAIALQCRRSAGMAGVDRVRRQLRKCCPHTRSEPERIVARGLTARNFYMSINTRVGRFYGDLVDYRARVVVEIDGRRFHIEPEVFNNDRRRQNEMVLGNWLVLRYSVATVMANLDAVLDEIISVVRRRRRALT